MALVALLMEESAAPEAEDPILQLQVPAATTQPMGQAFPARLPAHDFGIAPSTLRADDEGLQAGREPRRADYPQNLWSDESKPGVGSQRSEDCKGFGWQSLYRARGQQAFAWASRPRHLGAFTDAEARGMDETAKAVQTIARTLSTRDEAAGHEKGKLGSIGKTEERMVYLLRGCDNLTVPVAQATVGKELFHALKRTATQGRPMLRSIQFPVNINNRIAFGMASLSLGGKDTKALPDYCLSAADFPLTSEEDFDGFVGTVDNELEKRPKTSDDVVAVVQECPSSSMGRELRHGH